jgi:hypothetical protein
MTQTLDAPRPLSSPARAWADAWNDRRLRLEMLLTPLALGIGLAVMAHFLTWVEARPGVILPDPVLAVIPPRDMTWVTFALVYAGLLTAVVALLPSPRSLLLGMQAYLVMILLRMAVMSVTPLEAPPGMLPLEDPLVQLLGTGEILTRDLFFSGHTSTSFLLVLLAPGRLTRAFFLACTVAVAACVLWQHVHYTVDVLAAPPFAFVAYALVSKAHALVSKR